MEIRDEEIIRDKLNFYKEQDVAVHLSLKPTLYSIEKSFRNGKVIRIGENSVVLGDEKLGNILIYLSEIYNVEKREKKR